MRITDKLITPNEGAVVSLEELKEHLRWPNEDNSEDMTMLRKLEAAIEDFKDFTGRPVLKETWRMLFDNFSCRVVTLSKAPVDIETIVVSYYDVNNEVQVLSTEEYSVIDGGAEGIASIKFDGVIPSVYDKPQAVYIDYDAGWDTVPSKIIAGICEQAADYFEYRASDSKKPIVPIAYRAWYPYKLF